ncbi:MAG TPA: hypothetical protein VED59_02170 [Acidimicrobiales bacterium]|nr:hypothetical protein [Acidimicrobiales bacterium]
MANTQWLDRSHPQTLYMATVLLYVNAVFWAIAILLGVPWALIPAVAAMLAGLGLANEKRLGYWGALAIATIDLLYFLYAILVGLASLGLVINLLFAVVLFALLVHPMTRNYERIWFKKLNRGSRGNRGYRR